jgi:2-keto-4-pentenoate hydratase/2-oxohepta-3-ene-1,7-dioic acid hydratase in catechol pathway
MQYVLGYLVGNDVSARNYIPDEVSGFQMSYGKSFDKFAPLGPFVASPEIVGNPHTLRLTTKVNNRVRQDANTSDMIWNVPSVIAHLTKGRTLKAGTVVMMGTPSGVGWFMRPQGYVKSGDVVEVSIENLGSIRNEIEFI